MKSKIKNIIQEWTKQEDYDLCQSIKISQELKVNRNQIAKLSMIYLNLKMLSK